MAFYNGFLLSLSLCLDIGLANMAMITLAMSRGFSHGFWLGVGTCVGDLIYAMLAMSGMAVLLQFEMVRWSLWIFGSVTLIWLTIKMGYAALQAQDGELNGVAQSGGRWRLFGRGMVLALSSPTAILWFAAVGGAIIARQGADPLNAGLFLSGFFSAGIFWALVLCTLAYQGGRLLGEKMVRFSYLASALIFAYFACYVIYQGYVEFVPGAP